MGIEWLPLRQPRNNYFYIIHSSQPTYSFVDWSLCRNICLLPIQGAFAPASGGCSAVNPCSRQQRLCLLSFMQQLSCVPNIEHNFGPSTRNLEPIIVIRDVRIPFKVSIPSSPIPPSANSSNVSLVIKSRRWNVET